MQSINGVAWGAAVAQLLTKITCGKYECLIINSKTRIIPKIRLD